MIQGIYRIRNKLDDKRYVGSTNDFEKGWIIRQQALRRGDFYNIHLQRAWNKYGEENFVFEIEEEVAGDNKILLVIEQIYLDEGFALGILYNIARKAGGGDLGKEVNQKISKSHTGKKLSEEHKANIRKNLVGMLDKSHTDESKQKNSEWHLEYYESHDVWNKGKECPQLAGENNGFYGKFHTEETKQENRECHVEYYKTHVNPFKGKHHTDKTKAEHGKFMKEWYRCHEHQNAIDHPAFYNVQAKTFAPAGRNLSKLLREYGLTYYVFRSLITGKVKCSKDGWRIANEEEIAQLLDKKAGSQKS